MGKKNLLDDVKMYFKKDTTVYWRKNPYDLTFDNYFLNIKDRILEGHYSNFDKNGIPMAYHGSKIGFQYNPVTITSYALGNYQLFIETNDMIFFDIFLKMADWLVTNQKVNNNIGVWYYNFDWKNILKPWISGMAQGEAISVLIRAYKETEKYKYLHAAKLAINSFKHEMKEGGVVSYIDEKFKFYEEYVTDEPSHVLNGFIYALWGIFEFYQLTKDKSAYDLFSDGIYSLEALLPRFDSGFWSKYSINGSKMINIASYMYHELHIIQLNALNEIVSSEIIKDFEIKWRRYQQSYLNRFLALILKIIYKIIYR